MKTKAIWILPIVTLFVSAAMVSIPVYATDPVELKRAWPKWHNIDASQCNHCIDPFYAQVRNPNPNALAIRVVWSVWEFPTMEALGSLEILGEIDPPPKVKTFTADFDIWDPRWKFDGTTRMEYEVRGEVYYLDNTYWVPGIYVNPQAYWFRITVLP